MNAVPHKSADHAIVAQRRYHDLRASDYLNRSHRLADALAESHCSLEVEKGNRRVRFGNKERHAEQEGITHDQIVGPDVLGKRQADLG